MKPSISHINGFTSLSFDCDNLNIKGHETNGYFWESVVLYLMPELADKVELDSEADMFCAYGNIDFLEDIRELIEPYMNDLANLQKLVLQAEAEGFEFDD